MKLGLQVISAAGRVLSEANGDDAVSLIHAASYLPGDRIRLTSSESACHIMVWLEDTIAPALTYLVGGAFEFVVPQAERKLGYSGKSFSGERHALGARIARDFELERPHNLALNPLDSHDNRSLFPHATANVETRDEAVFAARNAIDGITENLGHGEWPYVSWGINRRADAELKLEFGRAVLLSEAVITLRADFPHDSWWTNAFLGFSDGTGHTFALEKTPLPQLIRFEPRVTESVALHSLVKAGDESPFPALRQIELWGVEADR